MTDVLFNPPETITPPRTFPVVRYIVAPLTRVEVRSPERSGNDTYTMQGYAAVFNKQTTLHDGRFARIDETIDARAFDAVLRDQPMGEAAGVVHFNFGHDMNRAVAATDVPAGQPGSLSLKTDKQGLYFEAKVPRDDPDGVALAAKMRSGVVKQASFAFTIAPGGIETLETSDEETGKVTYSDTIINVSHLYDVCACAQGAYSQTISGLRSYAAYLGRSPDGEAITVVPDMGGGTPVVSGEPEGGVDITPDPQRAAIFAAADEAVAAALAWRRRRLSERRTDVRTGHAGGRGRPASEVD